MVFGKFKSVAISIALGAMAMTSALNGAAIPVVSVTNQADGVFMKMQTGSMKLYVCSDAIIRVIYSIRDTIPIYPNNAFMVPKNWTTPAFALDTSSGSTITIVTAKIRAVVIRSTGVVIFLSSSGDTILQETPDGGKKMTAATVNNEATYHPEQRFVATPNEAIYGLGQFQNRTMNYRGIPLELLQFNTHISNPLMVSTRGYGILWANASKCFFNQPDSQIALTSGSGSFTTTAAGTYVFAIYDDMNCKNQSSHLQLIVNGTVLDSLMGNWIGPSVSGKISLPASTKVTVTQNYGNGTAWGGPFKNESKFTSEVGETIDYYFIYGPSIDNIISGYRTATGTAPMLGKWAFGYIHSKCQYNTETEIIDTARSFRNRNVPVDCIVQDWNYWPSGQWGSMTFNSGYPTPKNMIDTIHSLNMRFMISVWSNPQGSSALSTALSTLSGGEIPGSSFFDAFNPAARQVYWSYANTNLFSIGTDAFWQDSDEPEGDVLPGQTFADTVGNVSGNRVRLAYPTHVCMTDYNGQRSVTSTKRVCVLSRSAFIGAQRYGVINWSGDILGNWDYFTRQISAGMNYCMTGLPWWTTDIGGYFRPTNNAAFQELLTRWFEFGAFCPIFRIHGANNASTEPWNYGATVLANFLIYDKLRYRLLPYTYSLAWGVTANNGTIMRALPFDYPNDTNVWSIKDQFLFGSSFLVNPIMSAGATSRSVYLPAGTWYDFWAGTSNAASSGRTVTANAPIQTIPLYIKAGSIVPMGPEIQYSGQKQADTIELRVYPGANGSFTLYEDEGDGYNYENGAYATIPITFNSNSGSLTIGARSGTFTGMLQNRIFNIVFVTAGHGTGEAITTNPDCVVQYSGAAVTAPCQGPITGVERVESEKAVSGAQANCFKAVQDRVVFPAIYSGKMKSVCIYGLNGKLLCRKSVMKNSISLQKDMGLSKGVYYIRVSTTSDLTPIQK